MQARGAGRAFGTQGKRGGPDQGRARVGAGQGGRRVPWAGAAIKAAGTAPAENHQCQARRCRRPGMGELSRCASASKLCVEERSDLPLSL